MTTRSATHRRRGVDPGAGEFWDLRLYVAGRTSKSMGVLSMLEATCETHLGGRYRITLIDVVKNPRQARTDQIVATPTLWRTRPKPARCFIGNLSDVSQLLADVNPRCAEERRNSP